MKNILLLLVGGTICSALNEKGTLSVQSEAGTALADSFENSDSAWVGRVHLHQTRNLGILSENMTTDKWNTVIDTLKEYLSNARYDGIIIAHGTDTLAFSAALFSMLMSKADIPVFLVSAQLPLAKTATNGRENFRVAVESICRGISPRVYVPYKNTKDNRMYLHIGARLRQCENYSDDFFSSGALDITAMNEDNYPAYFQELDDRFPLANRQDGITLYTVGKLTDCVLKLSPYVGLRYDAIAYDRFKAVLHGTFHAGTACAQGERNAVGYLLDACLAAGVPVYISPMKMMGEVYDTVRVINEHTNVYPLYGCTNETTYVKLLLAYATFKTQEEILRYMQTNYHYEKGCDMP